MGWDGFTYMMDEWDMKLAGSEMISLGIHMKGVNQTNHFHTFANSIPKNSVIASDPFRVGVLVNLPVTASFPHHTCS